MNNTERLNASRATAIAAMGAFIEDCAQIDTGEFLFDTEYGQVSVLVTAKKTPMDSEEAHQKYLDVLAAREARAVAALEKKEKEAAEKAEKAAAKAAKATKE